MGIRSVNPVNGKTVATYKEETERSVVKKIELAQATWLQWKNTSFEERAACLSKTAQVLRERKKQLAELMAVEMGKPLKPGMDEVEKCASVCDYYAAHGASFLKDEMVETEAAKSYVSFQPIGVVLAVMPWNFPFWQAFRFLAPGLMAGNCGVLKHASNVTGCALAIESILLEGGFPKHVFQTLVLSSKGVKKVIAHPIVKAVTLTGSTGAGVQVAQQAASLLKKSVLELGGSDPYLILEDADLENAARICAESRLINNGQSCIAAKRFIVVKSVEKEFIKLFKGRMSAKKTGDPFEPDTDLGPMARTDLRDELHQQVVENIEAGAKCILGGKVRRV